MYNICAIGFHIHVLFIFLSIGFFSFFGNWLEWEYYVLLHCFIIFLQIISFFWKSTCKYSFRFTTELREAQVSQFLLPQNMHSFLIINIIHQIDAGFFSMSILTPIHYNHPKSIVYLRVPSQCTFYGIRQIRQMNNDI